VEGIVTEKDSTVYGRTTTYLNGLREDVRTQETNLGNLTADANLAAAQAIDPSVIASIKNGGGIREPIGATVETSPGVYERVPPLANPLSGKLEGEISQLDIENSLKFDNQLTLLSVTAEQLIDLMEHGVAATAPNETPGQFPQIAGMAFSFDASLPENDRVLSLAIKDLTGNILDVIAENGEVVGDPNRIIRLVTLNFLADGGDGYPFDTFGVDVVETEIGEQAALAEYLTANYSTIPYSNLDGCPELDERIQNLSVRGDNVLSTLSLSITANGEGQLLNTNSETAVSIAVSLDPSEEEGDFDCWVVARTPSGWMSYDETNGWQSGLRPCSQGPLSPRTSTEVLNESLAAGDYNYYIIVDDVMDGALNLDGTETVWLDYVQVKVK
jgi:hypothetical protein